MRGKNKMSYDKTKLIIAVLALTVLVMAGFIGYSFGIKPSINGYIVGKQLEARDIVITNLISQVQQQGYVRIGDANGNTMVLIPYQPPQNQQAQQAQQAQQTQQAQPDSDSAAQ